MLFWRRHAPRTHRAHAFPRGKIRQRPLLDVVRQTGRFLYRGEALSPSGDGTTSYRSRAVIETPDLLNEGERRRGLSVSIRHSRFFVDCTSILSPHPGAAVNLPVVFLLPFEYRNSLNPLRGPLCLPLGWTGLGFESQQQRVLPLHTRLVVCADDRTLDWSLQTVRYMSNADYCCMSATFACEKTMKYLVALDSRCRYRYRCRCRCRCCRTLSLLSLAFVLSLWRQRWRVAIGYFVLSKGPALTPERRPVGTVGRCTTTNSSSNNTNVHKRKHPRINTHTHMSMR